MKALTLWQPKVRPLAAMSTRGGSGVSSACWCGMDEAIGAIRGPHTARKAGFHCSCCGVEIRPGDQCVDIAFMTGTGGAFHRLHPPCHNLTQSFKLKVCGTNWYGGMDLDEAAEHAVSRGHEAFWQRWLELYWEATKDLPLPVAAGGSCE